jgi:HEAT repeat protein
MWALSSMTSDAASAALRRMIHSSNPRLVYSAINALDEIDEELAGELIKIARTGNSDAASAALSALGRAPKELSIPILKQMATSGPNQLRWSAIQALAETGDESSLAVLGDILRNGDRQSASAAAQALGTMGTPEARELIIEAALSERSDWTGAIYQLGAMQGEDVEGAFLDIIKNGSSRDRQIAIPRLLRLGNAEALRTAVETATNGSRSDSQDAMRMLADAGTPEAMQALLGLAERGKGQARVGALEALAQTNPGDPRLGRMLADSVFSGRKAEAISAVQVLGRLGTEEAQQALITAIGGADKELAVAATQALGQQGLSESLRATLVAAAATGDAKMKTVVMHQLMEQGAPEGLRLAEEVLNNKDAAVAQSAIYSLQQAGTPAARALIERQLAAKDPTMRAAAVEALAQNPTDATAEALLRMVRDDDARVRSSAMNALAQVGTERATQQLVESARRGSSEDRISAINSLSMVRDSASSKAIAELIFDADESVAQSAISSSYGGGADVDAALIRMLNNGSASQSLRLAAANQLRSRSTDLDEATEKRVTELAGPAEMYGGYGYGAYTRIY